MRHKHVGPLSKACTLCFVEAQQLVRAEDARSRTFWRWILVGFSFALAAVSAFVLFKVGMGR